MKIKVIVFQKNSPGATTRGAGTATAGDSPPTVAHGVGVARASRPGVANQRSAQLRMTMIKNQGHRFGKVV